MLRIGRLFLPCAFTFEEEGGEQCEVGMRYRYGDYEWVVSEVTRWGREGVKESE